MLPTLAMCVADDHVKTVEKMIHYFMVRLMAEANEETEHKVWCDTELSRNESMGKVKTEVVERLQAEIDESKGSVAA